MKLNKILSLLFALILLFSFCTVSVFASEEAPAVETAREEIAEAAEEAVSEHDGFEPMNFVTSLQYMVEGMICIIIVIGVLIIVTMVLNKVTATKKD